MREIEKKLIPSLLSFLEEKLDGRVRVYQYVPVGVICPYVSLELVGGGVENGLPSPHFQMRRKFVITVWSAYQGLEEVRIIIEHIETLLEGRVVDLGEGKALIRFLSQDIEGQQETRHQKLRQGILKGEALIRG